LWGSLSHVKTARRVGLDRTFSASFNAVISMPDHCDRRE
jgi:hypothetical protein